MRMLATQIHGILYDNGIMDMLYTTCKTISCADCILRNQSNDCIIAELSRLEERLEKNGYRQVRDSE